MGTSNSGSSGTAGIILATGVTCVGMTVLSGLLYPWVVCGAGVVVGLWAVQAINK